MDILAWSQCAGLLCAPAHGRWLKLGQCLCQLCTAQNHGKSNANPRRSAHLAVQEPASGVAELALRVAAKKDADGELQFGMGFDDPND